jgi:hypothetical protein
VADAIDAPDAVVAGEPVAVAVHVRNTGDASGQHEFTLLVNGEAADQAAVELDAAADATIEFTVAGLPAGDHELSVDGFADLRHSLWVMTPAQFVVDELTVNPEQVDLAVDPIVTVHVRYTNVGEAPGAHELVVTVDGRPTERLEVSLASGESGDATFTLTMDTPGHPVIAVDDVSAELWVLTPAEFVVDELIVTPEQVDLAVDPVVTAVVRFSNVGEAAGTHSLQLTLDGEPVEAREVSLASGESGEETFTLTMVTPGHPVIGVDDATAEVWVLAPPELAVGTVTLSPNPANLTEGNVVTVDAAVSNVGESKGAFTLQLALDGTVVETRDVTVAAGDTIEQQFALTLDHPGLQVVALNGVEVELEVYRIERPGQGTEVVNQLGDGSNWLTIDNQGPEDLYVVLTASGEGQPPLLGVYVHAQSTHTVRGIPSGSYATYFVHGSAWCTHYQRFTADADYGRFDEDSLFESTATTYTEVTLTFGATDGWSPTSDVDPTEFPR